MSQTEGPIRHVFTFAEDALRFRAHTDAGETTLDVRYADIPPTSRLAVEKDYWWRRLGLLAILYGAYEQFDIILGGLGRGDGVYWIYLGLGCLVLFKLTQTKMSVFPTDSGPIVVFQSLNHNAIVAEMMQRRKRQLEAGGPALNPDRHAVG